jgi:hypothetical protein
VLVQETSRGIEDRDETRTIRARVTGQVVALDPALPDTVCSLMIGDRYGIIVMHHSTRCATTADASP